MSAWRARGERARRPAARLAIACMCLGAARPAAALEPAIGLELCGAVPLTGRDFGRPAAIAAGPLGRLFVADPARGTVQSLGPEGAVQFAFDSPSGQPGMQPVDLEVAGFKVYVLDAQSNALLRFSDRGSFLDVLRRFDAAGGEVPRALSVEASGRVLVCFTPLHQVGLFDERTRVEAIVGGLGGGPGELVRPLGAAFAPDGSFYVADTGNGRLQRFTAVGNFERAFADSLGEPRGLAVGVTGEVYVADPRRRSVHLFGPTGVRRGGLVLPGYRPIDVTVVGDTLWALSADPPAILRARLLRGG